ncbi:MAG: tetratricopeptide repeat protein, partial [Armatimonadota bacterium]|nr:tetratricopeptide repeat protein [Armatimonadota bacterium]
MTPYLERANLLLQQGRFEMAEQLLRHALGEDPDDPVAHTLLSVALAHQGRLEEATREARSAIHLAPDFAYAHYALADALARRERLKEAEAAVEEAIRLDPEDPDHFGLQASIFLRQRRWNETLNAADQGLRLDPEHDACTNLRAMALVNLGRHEEAAATIEGALARDPENAFTHANRGWALLHQRRHREALECFREALRLDPQLEWARLGVVESLKARHLLYGWMLRYFLWMSRLGTRAQWFFVLGAWLVVRQLNALARDVPALRPFVMPAVVLYALFALLSWTADPLFNLLLRLNPYGRLALSREQIAASNWVGGVLLAGTGLFLAGLGLKNRAAVVGGIVIGSLIVPLSGI